MQTVKRSRTMTFGPEWSALWTDDATYVLLANMQHRQHTELVERIPSKVENRRHLLRVTGVFDDRARPPHTTLVAAVVVAQLVFHLVVQRDGSIDEARPRRPHDRHFRRRCTRRLQRRRILQTWYS